MTILDRILEVKRVEVKKLIKDGLANKPSKSMQDKPSLFETLKNAKHLHVISEIKRASPSKGVIKSDVNPVEQALAYERAGAAAISVLTDESFFKGSMDDLLAVSQRVNIPVLCKDFIIHRVQIDRALQSGASVILLIVSALNQEMLKDLHEYATSLGLEVIVEVHNLEELERALSIPVQLIGVNNRNLKTFEVDLSVTEKIAAKFPWNKDCVLISESGITNPEDANRVAQVGARAILVGETLMKSANIGEKLQSFHVKLGELS
jgi:indole-3-glycerol phosphate synthase